MENKNLMILSVVTEKHLKKIQYPLFTKTLNKSAREGNRKNPKQQKLHLMTEHFSSED